MNQSFFLLLILTLAACSSSGVKKQEDKVDDVTNASFSKDKPLTNKELRDFYSAKVKAVSPALQDETLDRFSKEEVSQIKDTGDQLLSITVLCSQGNFEQAFSLASKVFNRYQKVPGFWNQIANCHLKQGNSRKALLFYNKALELEPNYVPTLNNIGVLYSKQGQDQKALVAFERAYKASKFAKTPRYNLARIYLVYGLSDEALPILKGLIGDGTTDVELLNSLANAYFLSGRYQEAQETFSKISPSHWSQPEIGLNFSLTYFRLGNRSSAIKLFNSIQAPDSEDSKKYYALVRQELGGKK
jgi:tetratricopeptide (TPR) repeat protein